MHRLQCRGRRRSDPELSPPLNDGGANVRHVTLNLKKYSGGGSIPAGRHPGRGGSQGGANGPAWSASEMAVSGGCTIGADRPWMTDRARPFRGGAGTACLGAPSAGGSLTIQSPAAQWLQSGVIPRSAQMRITVSRSGRSSRSTRAGSTARRLSSASISGSRSHPAGVSRSMRSTTRSRTSAARASPRASAPARFRRSRFADETSAKPDLVPPHASLRDAWREYILHYIIFRTRCIGRYHGLSG